MTGLEVVYLMRTWHSETPILLVTAFPDPDLLEECRRLRVPVLKKPFPLYQLRAAALATMRGAEVL